MLKKLRVKFIAITMSMVAIVLFAVFSVICVIDYQKSLNDTYATLNAAVTHGAQPPKEARNPNEGAADSEAFGSKTDASESNAVPGVLNESRPLEIGGRENKRFIPVAVYTVGADNTLTASSPATTASISDETLAEAATQTASITEGSGLLDSLGLYFVKHGNGDETLIAFADQGSVNSWQTLALTLLAVGLAALLIFFVISLFFAQWALKPVKESWQQQQQFIADASHELKTPLTVMLASTSILLKHPDKSIASQSQWVEGIEVEADTMQKLVSDMLALATPEKDTKQRMFESVDLSDLVERNLLQFEALAFEQRITVSSSIEGGLHLNGSRARLERLVSTLLDNACKYVSEHGSINVFLRQTPHSLELAITNSGETISPDDLPHIFDRFYRADKARQRSIGGYGLGLAIAREVTEEHGGTIRVTSTERSGTTFTVIFPNTK